MEAKKLSIVIPYFKESMDVVYPLLSSINTQLGIDFSTIEVLLVNDGAGNKFSDDFISQFKNISIQTVMLDENGGPGVARQAGLDQACGEYVMFCDADDTLFSVCSLKQFFDEMQFNPDVISSKWLEEQYINGNFIYVDHDQDATWMHGKVLRREFLIENGISFDHELRVHEDSYFLMMVFELLKNGRHIQNYTYVWKWGEDSITRRNNSEYSYKSLPVYFKALAKGMKRYADYDIQDRLPWKVTQAITNIYFTLQQDYLYDSENIDERDCIERSFKNEFADLFRFFDNNLLGIIYPAEKAKFLNQYEHETYKKWMHRMIP